MPSHDFNTQNYTVNELVQLFFDDDINNITLEDINSKAKELSDKAYEDNNNELVNFIKESQDILIKNLLTDNEKDTDYVFNTSLMKGTMNPNYQQIITRFTNIDSQYKEIIEANNSNTTNFIFEFTETLSKVISINLYSLELPYAWYTFDAVYGTDVLMINNISYQITEGNYSPNDIMIELNSIFIDNNLDISASIIHSSGKTKLENKTSTSISFIFYDETNIVFENAKKNSNLGWMLGFRTSEIVIPANSSIISDAIVNTWGTRYIIMAIDDFNNNQTNKALIGLSRPFNKISLPTLTEEVNLVSTGNASNSNVARQITTLKNIPNAYLDSYNSINEDLYAKHDSRYDSPIISNIFAKIPIKKQYHWKDNQSYPIIEFSGVLQNNERTYFGPVDITRMKVTLYDDKGRVLNLNGLDWSFSLVTKHVYQYNTPLQVQK